MKTVARLSRSMQTTLQNISVWGSTAAEAAGTMQSRQLAAANLRALTKLGLVEVSARSEWKPCGSDGEEKLVQVKIYKLTPAGYQQIPDVASWL